MDFWTIFLMTAFFVQVVLFPWNRKAIFLSIVYWYVGCAICFYYYDIAMKSYSDNRFLEFYVVVSIMTALTVAISIRCISLIFECKNRGISLNEFFESVYKNS